MRQIIIPILSSVTLFTLGSCNDSGNTEKSTDNSDSSSSTPVKDSNTTKNNSTTESSQSEWDKITPETLEQVLLEEQVRELFKIEGEIKKSANASNVYGKTIAFNWRSDRSFEINGKKFTQNQPSSIVIRIPKVYGKATAAKAKQNFDFAFKPSSPDLVKKTIETKRKRDTPSELEIIMEDGVTAEENKRMMEIMKEKAAAGATGTQESHNIIKPVHERIDDNTSWSIGNESLSTISGTQILEIRLRVSHENEVSKKIATQTLAIIRDNLKKLP